LVWRGQAPYHFESMFRLSVAQGGAEVFAAVYGGRDQGKVNGFNFCQPGGAATPDAHVCAPRSVMPR
jgi:hypothetical protein